MENTEKRSTKEGNEGKKKKKKNIIIKRVEIKTRKKERR